MYVFCFISVPERLSILEKAIESCMDSQHCTGVRKKDIPDFQIRKSMYFSDRGYDSVFFGRC